MSPLVDAIDLGLRELHAISEMLSLVRNSEAACALDDNTIGMVAGMLTRRVDQVRADFDAMRGAA